MRKIVINACFGGFSLSDKAFDRINELKKEQNLEPLLDVRPRDRDDPILVQVVEEMGEEANGMFAQLRVIEIPSDVEWVIEDYDGIEHVAEKHRTWGDAE